MYSSEIPILRLLYSSQQKMIILSFHIMTPSVEAVQLFDFARKTLPFIALGESYYVNKSDELSTGQDAHAHYEQDVENYYLKNATSVEEEYEPDTPVTLALSYPIYAAGHPLAKDQAEVFRKRIALFKGKKI